MNSLTRICHAVTPGLGQGRSRRAMSSQPSSSAALAVIALRHPGHNVHHAQLDSGNRLEGTQGG
jgi:hypothetical protein